MPPKTKITEEMIVDAAFAIIREKGYEQLNARSIAAFLNCSTQPVLYQFRTVDEIRQAAFRKADALHSEYIIPKGKDEEAMLTMGLNYVRFAHEEKNLFRFLFQTDHFDGMNIGTLMKGEELNDIISVISGGMNCDEDQAREMFISYFCLVHGLASLLANNSMEYDEALCRKMLEDHFLLLTGQKG